jgi:hypothetical protein
MVDRSPRRSFHSQCSATLLLGRRTHFPGNGAHRRKHQRAEIRDTPIDDPRAVPAPLQPAQPNQPRPGRPPFGRTLPATLGVRAADPNRKIVALAGDDDCQFMIEERAVAA